MYIDIEKAKNEFINYTNKYDLTDDMINLKQSHSLRVMNISKLIAQNLNLNQEDTEVACLIGLLHDIGRFDQQTNYKTFNDLNSFDHGDYGAKILDNDLRSYVVTGKYDSLIKTAVKNHNKYKIESGLTDREILFSKIVRDADKLDILYQATYRYWNGIEEEINNSDIMDTVLSSIKNQQLFQLKKGENYDNINSVLYTVGFVFDINYKSSFQILKSRNYINKIFDRFEYKDPQLILDIRHRINKYIDEHI